MKLSALRRVFRSVRYSRNAAGCLKKLKARGFKIAIVSTGLQFMPDRIKKELGVDYAVSNRLRFYRGTITGGVKINLAHGAKHKVLKTIFRKFSVMPHEVISVGDSEGDVPLANQTGYSISFNCTSGKLARTVDYNCRSKDFAEVYRKIMEINHE
jgi:phosphoserine phosphatase